MALTCKSGGDIYNCKAQCSARHILEILQAGMYRGQLEAGSSLDEEGRPADILVQNLLARPDWRWCQLLCTWRRLLMQ